MIWRAGQAWQLPKKCRRSKDRPRRAFREILRVPGDYRFYLVDDYTTIAAASIARALPVAFSYDIPDRASPGIQGRLHAGRCTWSSSRQQMGSSRADNAEHSRAWWLQRP